MTHWNNKSPLGTRGTPHKTASNAHTQIITHVQVHKSKLCLNIKSCYLNNIHLFSPFCPHPHDNMFCDKQHHSPPAFHTSVLQHHRMHDFERRRWLLWFASNLQRLPHQLISRGIFKATCAGT